MTKLEYTFKSDILFKMVFVKFPALLKRVTAELLGIPLESIGEFVITNTEIPPEESGDKFCRLDINMTVNGQRVDLEIQVSDEGDYPERSLYYWAREYSTALEAGKSYSELPRTIVVSILAFNQFDCEEFHSEFQPLEVTRHTPLTDRQVMHYFELPKLPDVIDPNNELKLWLALFKADTEEDLEKIEKSGVPVMKEAIAAYRQVTATEEYRERERIRLRARHNEASALQHARQLESRKWQAVIAEKDAAHIAVISEKNTQLSAKDTQLLEKNTQLLEKDTQLSEKNTQLSEKDTQLSEKDALIAELKAQIRKGSQ